MQKRFIKKVNSTRNKNYVVQNTKKILKNMFNFQMFQFSNFQFSNVLKFQNHCNRNFMLGVIFLLLQIADS